ncbi:hypothetical protein IP86_12070 [Rhodopseudomonas sp. AAP120]|nr:hypothetical protein IP86_12070 [Rhodopseudomonas sp. AAP120]
MYSLGIGSIIPAWVVYSMPFALWTFSYMLFVRVIWFELRSLSAVIWLWTVPVVALASEIGQSLRLVPGTFDIIDMITIAFAIAAALAFDRIIDVKQSRAS